MTFLEVLLKNVRSHCPHLCLPHCLTLILLEVNCALMTVLKHTNTKLKLNIWDKYWHKNPRNRDSHPPKSYAISLLGFRFLLTILLTASRSLNIGEHHKIDCEGLAGEVMVTRPNLLFLPERVRHTEDGQQPGFSSAVEVSDKGMKKSWSKKNSMIMVQTFKN